MNIYRSLNRIKRARLLHKKRNTKKLESFQFSDYYHKARKNLILFSGILFGLTFAGFKINQTINGNYEKEIPNTDIRLTLDNPEVIPYILVLLIIYFCFRLYIEWKLCSQEKQILLPARVDYYSSFLIGIISICAYFIQSTFNYQLIDIIDINFVASTLFVIILGEIAGLIYRRIIIRKINFTKNKTPLLTIILIFISGLVFFLISMLRSRYPLITLFMSAIIGSASFLIFYKSNFPNILLKMTGLKMFKPHNKLLNPTAFYSKKN